MPDNRQVSNSRNQPRRAAATRSASIGGLLQNALFALSFGFAAAIVLGFVH